MNGGHGEWFVQGFASDGTPSSELASLRPEAALEWLGQQVIAGNRAEQFAELGGGTISALAMLADARHVLTIPEALLTDNLSPIYGRAPDAKAPSR